MKKIYSMIAMVAMATVANAQGTENFDTQTNTAGTSYTTVNFTGAGNTLWALAITRIIDTATNYNISGSSALLNTNGTVTITFPNGVGNLAFQYRKGFTGGTARSIQVSVNGTVVDTTPTFGAGSGADATVYNYSYAINKTASTVVEVKILGAQTTVDNFVWTAPSTLGVADYNTVKNSMFVKNTLVSDEVAFGAKSNDVKVFNMNSQVVKAAAVSENRNLNVADLNPGMYIITGTVNGKPVSQKIIKK